MGMVYLAERVAGGFTQRAALKLMRPGAGTGELAARFLTERQILAHLEHPDIARLLDGGAGPQGERITLIAGAAGHTGDLAAAVCAATALRLTQMEVPAGVHAVGDDVVHALDLLHHATVLGVRVQEFTGVARATSW